MVVHPVMLELRGAYQPSMGNPSTVRLLPGHEGTIYEGNHRRDLRLALKVLTCVSIVACNAIWVTRKPDYVVS